MHKQFKVSKLTPTMISHLHKSLCTFNSTKIGKNKKHTLFLQGFDCHRIRDGYIIKLVWIRLRFYRQTLMFTISGCKLGTKFAIHLTTDHRSLLRKLGKMKVKHG